MNEELRDPELLTHEMAQTFTGAADIFRWLMLWADEPYKRLLFEGSEYPIRVLEEFIILRMDQDNEDFAKSCRANVEADVLELLSEHFGPLESMAAFEEKMRELKSPKSTHFPPPYPPAENLR